MKTHYIEIDGLNYPVDYEQTRFVGFVRHSISYQKGRKKIKINGESLDKVVGTFKEVIRNGNRR